MISAEDWKKWWRVTDGQDIDYHFYQGHSLEEARAFLEDLTREKEPGSIYYCEEDEEGEPSEWEFLENNTGQYVV